MPKSNQLLASYEVAFILRSVASSPSSRAPGRASTLSSWTRTIVDALRAHGIDPAPILVSSGFSEDSFRDPNARHPIADTARLWRRAAEAAGDPAFGLKVPKYVRQTTFHALGYSVLASVTLRDAVERAVRFCHVVADAGLLELSLEHEQAQLRMRTKPGYEAGGIELKDAVLSMIVRIFRSLTERAFRLSAVQLKRPAGTDLTPYERFFDCPVTLSNEDMLSFEASMLDLPLRTGNAELARFSDAALRDYLSRMATGTVVDRVRAAIADQLATELSPEKVAKQLGLSVRSMQRSLLEHETSYGEVLRVLRVELARSHLREGQYSVTEIAFLLGYEDLTTFARAFKRWTGDSPTEYAAKLR